MRENRCIRDDDGAEREADDADPETMVSRSDRGKVLLPLCQAANVFIFRKVVSLFRERLGNAVCYELCWRRIVHANAPIFSRRGEPGAVFRESRKTRVRLSKRKAASVQGVMTRRWVGDVEIAE